ncbi:MAG TPA: F0F1 ATP synthase subunit epsilon [Acidimicrobiales bacterium]|nr:F0F1 ATP synthase subunit epsilon [Acidimicrobiales bacterium]
MPTHVELVTPERVLHSGEADFVVLRAEGGEIMFLPHHTDFVGAVDICVVRIAAVSGGGAEAEASEVRAAMAGGFVHVADNRVTVLASVAELAREIDVARARHALEEAEAAEGGGAPAGGEAPATPAEGHAGEEELGGSTMLALLKPDLPEVRARRARARLEAAGVLEGAAAPAAAPH